MTLPLCAADVLAGHLDFELDCVDRVYLNAYVPMLAYPRGVASFFRCQRGATFASTCLADPITKAFTDGLHRYAARHHVPVIYFEKGQRKDDLALAHLSRFNAPEGVLFIGVAQEKVRTFRTERRRNPATGQRYPWIVSATAVVNQYYVYALDADFGPFFLKFSSYFPYPAKLCFNGHHWAQRQARAAGISFTELDNGFAACADPAALQRICDQLTPRSELLAGRLCPGHRPGDESAGWPVSCAIIDEVTWPNAQVAGQPGEALVAGLHGAAEDFQDLALVVFDRARRQLSFLRDL